MPWWRQLTRLGGAVIHLPPIPRQTGDGRQGDNTPTLACANHGHDQRAQHIVKTTQVGVDHAVPVVAAHGGEGVIPSDTGVAYNAVKGAVLLQMFAEDRKSVV